MTVAAWSSVDGGVTRRGRRRRTRTAGTYGRRRRTTRVRERGGRCGTSGTSGAGVRRWPPPPRRRRPAGAGGRRGRTAPIGRLQPERSSPQRVSGRARTNHGPSTPIGDLCRLATDEPLHVRPVRQQRSPAASRRPGRGRRRRTPRRAARRAARSSAVGSPSRPHSSPQARQANDRLLLEDEAAAERDLPALGKPDILGRRHPPDQRDRVLPPARGADPACLDADRFAHAISPCLAAAVDGRARIVAGPTDRTGRSPTVGAPGAGADVELGLCRPVLSYDRHHPDSAAVPLRPGRPGDVRPPGRTAAPACRRCLPASRRVPQVRSHAPAERVRVQRPALDRFVQAVQLADGERLVEQRVRVGTLEVVRRRSATARRTISSWPNGSPRPRRPAADARDPPPASSTARSTSHGRTTTCATDSTQPRSSRAGIVEDVQLARGDAPASGRPSRAASARRRSRASRPRAGRCRVATTPSRGVLRLRRTSSTESRGSSSGTVRTAVSTATDGRG